MEQFFTHKILPAVTIEDPSKSIKIAEAILNGGLNVMEVPLRTGAAFRSIEVIRQHLPELYIGAGTILNISQLEQAQACGAQFGLAPGFNPTVVTAARKMGFPFIPGVMTPSEIEQALELSCTILKLFPIGQVGGTKMLSALEGPYGGTNVKFIPMGGVTLENMDQYLAHKNVIAVGGSWLANKNLIAADDYNTITKNAEDALKVSRINAG